MNDVLSAAELIDGVLAEFNSQITPSRMSLQGYGDIRSCATTGAMLELSGEQQVAIVREIVSRQVARINGSHGSLELGSLLSHLLRKKLPFGEDDLTAILGELGTLTRSSWWDAVSPGAFLRIAEEHVSKSGLTDAIQGALESLAARLGEHRHSRTLPNKLHQRVVTLLGHKSTVPESVEPIAVAGRIGGVELTTHEPWVEMLRGRLAELDGSSRGQFEDLLRHCQRATSSKPSAKWLKQMQALVCQLGRNFAEIVRVVLGEIGKPGPIETGPPNALGFNPDPTQVHDVHSNLLRGLVWAASLIEGDDLATELGDTTDVCFKKLTGIGPRAPKIGNACLWALANMSSEAALAQLGRIKSKAKHASVKTQLGKALDTAALKTGMSAEDLEEVAVPTFGLSAEGEYRKALGEVTAVLAVRGGQVDLSWLGADGQPRTSVPKATMSSFADDVKALKKTHKELAGQLAAQRSRLERLFTQERSWSHADWRTRFVDHPLVGPLARRLLWRFTQDARVTDGLWHDGRLIDAHGNSLTMPDQQARVSLWHPIDAQPVQVAAWRDRLLALETCQPFKQAHREIYILTDAERQAGDHSVRFAAHILKQHQFNALCLERGWEYRLQGEWDSANTPTLRLPAFNLRAEFDVEPVAQDGPLTERADLSHHLIYIYVATNQVRFYAGDSAIPMSLAEVPARVLSEVMRDIDLFVGVSSVGNNPNWQDGELRGRFGRYVEDYSFGELFPSAQTRRVVLEKIVPRLKIADRCSLGDRYLVVRGNLRTYHIHMGSGSIKMSPHDLYLCIVPDRRALEKCGKVYLPFEGDSLLSSILSKALLLADDSKITDPSIAQQIRAPR